MNIRNETLPMTEHDLFVEERLGHLKGRVKHCFRSAYSHLKKSWLLHHVDNEMSAFRAITAEEEAATGFILALKQLKYPGAKQLNYQSHSQKMAVFNIIQAVHKFLTEMNVIAGNFSMNKVGQPRIMITIDVSKQMGLSEPFYIQPDNPLNFSVVSEDKNGKPISAFTAKIHQIYQGTNFKDFDRYLDSEANRRNSLLYATNDGIPSVEFEDSFIISRLTRVRIIGLITIALLQDRSHQLLVKQCIEEFVLAIPRLKSIAADPSVFMKQSE